MKTDEPMTISIVGKGAVGTALANQCAQKGIEVHFVRIQGSPPHRSQPQASPSQEQQSQGLPHHASPPHASPTEHSMESWLNALSEHKPHQHWVILTVPDDVVMQTVDSTLNAWQSISQEPISCVMDAIVHTSGVRSSEDFQHFQDQGVLTASMHPIQINITLEGDAPFLSELAHFCQDILDAHPISVTRTQKQQIHAAAVLASNYLFPNLSLASTYLQDAGLSPTLLEPLASQTVQAALQQGLAAISGPVARLDYQTIWRNMDVLSSHSAAKQRYIEESIFLVNQLLKTGHYDGKRDQAQDLLKMLQSER
jgi:predicted short-subunit dehydrogenase-like oxidoreductase (DUF2520 family)